MSSDFIFFYLLGFRICLGKCGQVPYFAMVIPLHTCMYVYVSIGEIMILKPFFIVLFGRLCDLSYYIFIHTLFELAIQFENQIRI